MWLLEYVFYSFIGIACFQVCFYLFFIGRFAFTKPEKEASEIPPISVIVYSKNNENSIINLLEVLLKQDYPNFEIVVINNASHDNTRFKVEDFAINNSKIKLVNVENIEAFWGNKKYAITLGIKASSHEHLLFTDANSLPNSKLWIKDMSAHFNSENAIILGYSSIPKVKHSVFNKIVRFENFITSIVYFSSTKIGLPFMGNGQNLAYTKHTFLKNNGFIKHIQLHHGEADLFINEVANKKNTTFTFSPKTFITTTPPTHLKNWINNLRKKAETTKLFKLKHRFILSLFFITQILFWAVGIGLLFTNFWKITLLFIGIRCIAQYFSIGFSAKKLKETDLIYWLLILEPFLILMHLSIFIANCFTKPNYWK